MADYFYQSKFDELEGWLEKKKSEIESTVFVSYNEFGVPYPSAWYHYRVLEDFSTMGVGKGPTAMHFYTGQTIGQVGTLAHGLVNVAAFLAHAMAVSIRFDVCDEFNVDKTDGTNKFALSNSCGQWGRSYQDEECKGDGNSICSVDTEMSIRAVSKPRGSSAAPPFECTPKESETSFTGYWESKLEFLEDTFPYSNRFGATHVEGCCYWGRGILLTRGACYLGRMNSFIGSGAGEQGYKHFYDVDICAYPEIICAGKHTKELRIASGLFEWTDMVQSYKNEEGLEYMAELHALVSNGFVDVNRFIDIVTEALPFRCFESNCQVAEQELKQLRRDNFVKLLLNVLDIPGSIGYTHDPTPRPTRRPTQSFQAPIPITDRPTKPKVPTPMPSPKMMIQTPRPTFEKASLTTLEPVESTDVISKQRPGVVYFPAPQQQVAGPTPLGNQIGIKPSASPQLQLSGGALLFAALVSTYLH
ncbi:hypothetical protein THAOC_13449 [Thalassiosira oceanica]|uniref:Uncharacterized protein n=1 Tax=Thalassiosira oceanica TaxID=159749 RepID=K0SL48_THAOC|nr:hypothetical protein THAOC_13449 [Thalassiosira oceanica]|eukprot:EJK65669.1 hypothetical protein THAOC_13449 [Thalassiosira oceanica]